MRQPYSVDAVSQAIGEVVFENRARFEPGIREIIEERGRVMEALRTLPGVTAYPSDSNWILFSMEDAGAAWQYLYDRGVLVRDFSSAPCSRAVCGRPSARRSRTTRSSAGCATFCPRAASGARGLCNREGEQ